MSQQLREAESAEQWRGPVSGAEGPGDRLHHIDYSRTCLIHILLSYWPFPIGCSERDRAAPYVGIVLLDWINLISRSRGSADRQKDRHTDRKMCCIPEADKKENLPAY
ncbi:hypothetical protein J6590_069879 [Homalodisca vitripennis]|nr:hypothetical protein J6590_069879 [Homalodisca vitripennis]